MYSRAVLLERVQLALLRGLAAAGALFLSVWIWHRVFSSLPTIPWTIYVWPAALLAVAVMVAMWNTPAKDPDEPIVGTLIAIGKGILTATVVLLAFSFFYRDESYSRGALVVLLPVATVALSFAAVTHVVLMRLLSMNTVASRRVMIVGFGEHGRRIARAIRKQPGYYSVVGYLEGTEHDSLLGDEGLRNLGCSKEIDFVIQEHDIEIVLIALTDSDEEFTQELIGVCMSHGVEWKVVPPMFGLILDHVEFEYVDRLPLVGQRSSRLVGYNWHIKRAFDAVVSAVLLVLLSPILLGAYVAVRVTSPGPGIFRQRRVGLRGRPFTFYKFRTMQVDSPTDVHQNSTARWILGKEVDAQSSDALLHKIENDTRITKVGRFLRASSIDELPQLWNVLRGDMSLVGPRPPIAYEVARYSEWHKRRLEVPPGVTGLWQVSGRNRLTFDEMVDLDIDYIERWTFGLDMQILLKTIPAVVSDRGH